MAAKVIDVIRLRTEVRVFDTEEDVFDAVDRWMKKGRREREFKVRPGASGKKLCTLFEGVEVVATGRGCSTSDALVDALKQWEEKYGDN